MIAPVRCKRSSTVLVRGRNLGTSHVSHMPGVRSLGAFSRGALPAEGWRSGAEGAAPIVLLRDSPLAAARSWRGGAAAGDLGTPTVRELVGQRFVVALSGTSPSPALLGRVRRGEIGGVILFGSNIESPAQLRRLTATLQEAARDGGRPPLLIATDQEGGQVRRLPWAGPRPATTALGRLEPAAIRARGAGVREGPSAGGRERRSRPRRRRAPRRLVHGARAADVRGEPGRRRRRRRSRSRAGSPPRGSRPP